MYSIMAPKQKGKGTWLRRPHNLKKDCAHLKATARPWCGCCKMTVRFPCDFTGTVRAASGNLAITVRGPHEYTIFLRFAFGPHVHQKSCDCCTITLCHRTMPMRGLCDAIYDMYTGYGLTIFKNLSNSSRNQIVEAAEPVNPQKIARSPHDARAAWELRAVYGRRRHIVGQM